MFEVGTIVGLQHKTQHDFTQIASGAEVYQKMYKSVF